MQTTIHGFSPSGRMSLDATAPNTQGGARRAEEGKVRAYHRSQRILSVLEFTIDFSLLVLLLSARWSVGIRTFSQRLTGGPASALLVYLLIVGVIFEVPGSMIGFVKGFWLEHHYGLSRMTFWRWILDQIKGIALSATLAILGAELVYWMLRNWPQYWWAVCAALFAAFFILLAHLAPVLLFPIFFKFKPLEDAALAARLEEFSKRAGTRVRGVFEWKLGEKTKKANAALMGSGRTRRIILSDTLLENFDPDEIEAVLAHEFGHHVRGHILKGMLVQTATTFAGFYLAARALNLWSASFGLEGPADFANLPLLILVSVGLSLILLPAMSAFSRRMEWQADSYALMMIRDKAAFISSMEKLAEINLGERRPPAWIEFIFHSHPSIDRRIAFAQNWRS